MKRAHPIGPEGARLPGHIFYDVGQYLLLFGDALHDAIDLDGDGTIETDEAWEALNPLPGPLILDTVNPYDLSA